jgi:hypothetical protein
MFASLEREQGVGLALGHYRGRRRHQAPEKPDRRGHQRRADERPARGEEADASDLGAEPREVDVERVPEPPPVADEPLHELHEQEEEDEAGEKDHPPLEDVEKALGLGDAVAVDEDADDPDPDGVHDDRDRHGEGEEHELLPERPAVEHREDVGEAHDREEVAQPRAGLGDLEHRHPEVDDVALEIDRDAGEGDEPHPELRGDELERGVDLPVEELGQRQHEDEVQHRRPEHPAAGPAEAGEHDPPRPHDQRVEDEVVDPDEVAGGGEGEGEGDDRDPGPAVGHRRGGRRHRLHLAEEHVERQDRDHRPVAELGSRPCLGEAGEPDAEERQRREDGDEEPGGARDPRGEAGGKTGNGPWVPGGGDNGGHWPLEPLTRRTLST